MMITLVHAYVGLLNLLRISAQLYGVKAKPITTRNPQANAIVERVHLTIGNMIRTFLLYDKDGIDDDDPWSGILTTVTAAVHNIYSTIMQAMPMQLVFGHDAIINTKFIADWEYKYGGPEYKGPYAITTVNDNGTVHIQWRKFYDVVNIRNIKPYYCLLYTSPSPRDGLLSRMPSSA